jgi:NADPH2:quinone reductase
VESISESTDDSLTRELLNKRVVFISDPSQDGSFAQYVKCDRRVVAVVPDEISFHEAACIPIAGCTAFESLEKVGLSITSDIPVSGSDGIGKRLLVVGGAGGVGSWITQLARANFPKLDIVCTVGSTESSRWCEKMGCNKTIEHNEIETLGAGPKGSCDYIICLTEPTPLLFSSLSDVLRPNGKICLVVSGDGIKKLDLSFIFFKSGTVTTQTVFSSMRDGFHLDQAGEMTIILELMRHKRINAPISETWEEAKSDWHICNKHGGHIDLVGSEHTKGKLVMKVVEK